MKPKVSVIIPVYNAEKYIEETIDSVLNQTYEPIEVIIIDDHSTDASYNKALNFKSERVHVHRNLRKGACAARNYGFEMSTGDYLQFLDADDLLSSDKISAQMNLVEGYGKNVLYSCIWGHFETHVEHSTLKNQAIDKDYQEPYLWLKDSWKGGGMGQTSIWLIHRDLIDASGVWDESLLINQDGEFISRVILNADQIKFSDNGVVYYRKGNPNSLSQSYNYSEQKATSLLHSYSLYKENALNHERLEVLKEGLAQNFLMFIYQFYNQFPDLVKTAEDEFYDLGYKKMWPVGGKNFIKLAKIFGFKNILKLRVLSRSMPSLN